MIIGIQGVQGSGKSTLVQNLCQNSNYESVSIDDFYLPKHQLDSLYYYTKDPAYKVRGNPGTHDIKLLLNTIERFKNRKRSQVPVYDKYAYDGKGDRMGFRTLHPCSVLFVEGWCIGFQALDTRTNIDNALKTYEKMYKYFDSILVLKPPSFDVVYTWREEAESKVRNQGKACMSTKEVASFIDTYMPTYLAYTPKLYEHGLADSVTLIIELDHKRDPLRAYFV